MPLEPLERFSSYFLRATCAAWPDPGPPLCKDMMKVERGGDIRPQPHLPGTVWCASPVHAMQGLCIGAAVQQDELQLKVVLCCEAAVNGYCRKSRRHSRSPVPRRDRDAGGNGYRGRRDGRDSKEEPSRSNREVRDAGPQTNREARMAAAGGSDRGRGGAAKANGRCDAPLVFSRQYWHCDMFMQAFLKIAAA